MSWLADFYEMEKKQSAGEAGWRHHPITGLTSLLNRLRAGVVLRVSGAATLVDHLPDAVLIHRDGKIVYANALAASLHGAGSAREIIGRNPLELIHPDDHARTLAWRKKVEHGPPSSEPLEIRRLRMDGTEFDARVRSSKIMWRCKPAYLVVARPSTQREDIRQALRESEQRYRDLIERSTFGVQISRATGERLFVNRKFFEMFGYGSAEEMLAISEPGALVAPYERKGIVAHREARERGEPAPDVYE